MDVYMNMLNNTVAIPASPADLPFMGKPSAEDVAQKLSDALFGTSFSATHCENDEQVLTLFDPLFLNAGNVDN